MDHIHEAIPGWFDFADLYSAAVAAAPSSSPAHFVEVGTFFGKSAAFMAVEIANSGKPIRFETCDTFDGVPQNAYTDPGAFAEQEAFRAQFGSLEEAARRQLAPVAAYVTIRVGHSLQLAKSYPDASLDFVFLDNDHSAPHVAAELEAWWPKIKPGGLLAGHDVDWPSVATSVGGWCVRTGQMYRKVSQRCWVVQRHAPLGDTVWTVPRKRRKCLVAVCCNERQVYPETAESLVALGWGQRVLDAAKQHEFSDIQFAWFRRYLTVPDLRDEAVLAAMKLEASHILFLDADMTWPSDLLARMLAHHHRGIVSGLYFLKRWPHSPVALRDGTYNPVDKQTDYHYDYAAPGTTDLRREQLIGMGCALVPMEVFRRMPRPWFAYQQNLDGMSVVTEDVWFCQQAAALGVPIWLDPTIVCRHLGVQHIDMAWFERGRVEQHLLSQALASTEKDDALRPAV